MSQNFDPQERESSNSDEIQENNANLNDQSEMADSGLSAQSQDPDGDPSGLHSDDQSTQPSENEQVEKSAPSPKDDSAGPYLIARYGQMRLVGEFRYHLEKEPVVGTQVVLRTERGVEMGKVLIRVCEDTEPQKDTPDDNAGCGGGKCPGCTKYGQIARKQLSEFIKKTDPSQPLRKGGKVLRIANTQDLVDHRHLESAALDKKKRCEELIKELSLDMQIVYVEHLLGGERIIFCFLAEHRVDFRELVRKLASEYRTRIEMRQVGARDEARLIADFERCGQRCCCQQFLKDLKPVSMRMAKTQKATLDPTKISGRCGRLMCCLRYEDKTYQQLKAKLPHRNIWVRTETLVGRVVDSQILTQLVRIQLPDRTFSVIANEDILERNIPEPTPQEAAKMMAAPTLDIPSISPKGSRNKAPIETKDTDYEYQSAEPAKNALDEVELDPGWGSLLGGDVLSGNKKEQKSEKAPSSDKSESAVEGKPASDTSDKPGQNTDANKKNKSRRRRPRRRRKKK